LTLFTPVYRISFLGVKKLPKIAFFFTPIAQFKKIGGKMAKFLAKKA